MGFRGETKAQRRPRAGVLPARPALWVWGVPASVQGAQASPPREGEAVGSHEGAGPGSCAPDASSSPAGPLRPRSLLPETRGARGESPGHQSGLRARTGAGVLGRGCRGSWARRPASPAPFVSTAPLRLPPFSFLPRLRKTFIRSPRSKSAPSHPLAGSRSRGGPPPAVLPSQSPSPWVAGCWGECRRGRAAGGGASAATGSPRGSGGARPAQLTANFSPSPPAPPPPASPRPGPRGGGIAGRGPARRPAGVALGGSARAACWRM